MRRRPGLFRPRDVDTSPFLPTHTGHAPEEGSGRAVGRETRRGGARLCLGDGAEVNGSSNDMFL
jgi:hypothetical protein